MEERIISYNEILQFAGKVDTSKQVRVLLSRYQAFLFRKKTKMLQDTSFGSPMGNTLGFIKFIAIALAILITCPKVAFLSDFRGSDNRWLDRLVFEDYDNKVLVIFNPPDLRESGTGHDK